MDIDIIKALNKAAEDIKRQNLEISKVLNRLKIEKGIFDLHDSNKEYIKHGKIIKVDFKK